MKNRIFYILMSTTLTAFAFGLSACSGGGGNPAQPQKQALPNTTLNQKSGAPGQWNGGQPTQGTFPAGAKFTITQPSGQSKVQKTLLGGNSSSTATNSAGLNSSASTGGLDKAVGPAPTVASTSSSAGVVTRSAITHAQSDRVTPPSPQLEKINPQSISSLATLPRIDLMSPASAKNFHATNATSIQAVMHDSSGHKEVLRAIKGGSLRASPKVATSRNAVARNAVDCSPKKKTTKTLPMHKKTARKVALSKPSAVDTKYMDRYDKLPVHVLWYDEQFNLWHPQKVPFGTCLMTSAVNGNSTGAVTPKKSSFSEPASEYDSYTPNSVFYKFASSPVGISPENTACDVSVGNDSNDYQNLPCLVFQKDTVAPGVEHETAYLLYVERKFDGSYTIVRKDDPCLTDPQSIHHAYEKQFVKNFLLGELDGTYILSFKNYVPNSNQQ